MTEGARGQRALAELDALDKAVLVAIAETPTPELDRAMGAVTSAADYSRLSIAAAAALAIAGGSGGRRAAWRGLASVGVTAAIVNVAVKPALRRARPVRDREPPPDREVRMPISASFPSGHSAAAFAFAAGAGHGMPAATPPLTVLAAVVAYSRVHTGVHFPTDVIAGSLIGIALAEVTNHLLGRRGA